MPGEPSEICLKEKCSINKFLTSIYKISWLVVVNWNKISTTAKRSRIQIQILADICWKFLLFPPSLLPSRTCWTGSVYFIASSFWKIFPLRSAIVYFHSSQHKLCVLFSKLSSGSGLFIHVHYFFSHYILSPLSDYFKCHRLFNFKQFSPRRRRRSEILMITFSKSGGLPVTWELVFLTLTKEMAPGWGKTFLDEKE